MYRSARVRAVTAAVDGEHPRRFVRYRMSMTGTLYVPAGGFAGTTINASRRGLCLKTDAVTAIGERCRVQLYTHRGRVAAAGEVVWTAPGRVAVRFTIISQADEARLNSALSGTGMSAPPVVALDA